MKIPFETEARRRYYSLLDKVFDSNMWSDGPILKEFEERFTSFSGLGSCGVSNGGVALQAILEFLNVKGREVVVPSNTFWATPQAVRMAGGTVVYADCNREDLCLSLEDLKARVSPRTAAVIVVHIGGHLAFQIQEIAAWCKEMGIPLVEDCAHAHGAQFHGKMGGSWGFAGAYSFYATKTLPTGEGGMIVSNNNDFLIWAKKFRNYGKEVVNGKVTYPILNGFNFRMNEMTAALGIVQLERLPEILEWKGELASKFDRLFENRVRFPSGMKSGFYKYIVFEEGIKEKTGKVYDSGDQCHNIEGVSGKFPNTDWVSQHHQCPPIYFGWEKATHSLDHLRKTLLTDQ